MPETTRASVFESTPPRVVRLHLAAGERVPPHSHPGAAVVLHVLAGRVELTVGEETITVESGELVRFAGEHDVSPCALADSVVLVLLCPRPED